MSRIGTIVVAALFLWSVWPTGIDTAGLSLMMEPDGTGIEQPTQTPEERAAERDTQREDAQRAHNERSGGGEVRPGEIGEQRQEHNERTAGQ